MADEHSEAAEREHRVNRVIAAYLEAERLGQAPDPHDLLAQYPDLAPELKSFCADHQRLKQLAQPPQPAPSPGPGPEERGPDNGGTWAYVPTEAATLAPGEAAAAGGR